MRTPFLLLLLPLCTCVCAAPQVIPKDAPHVIPPHGERIEGLSPVLSDLAALQADGKPWIETAVSHGLTLRSDSRDVLVEFNANGQYCLVLDRKPARAAVTFPATFRNSLAERFPTIEILDTDDTTHFRAWCPPLDVPAVYRAVKAQTATSTAAPYHPPLPQTYGSWATQGTYDMYADYYQSMGVTGSGVQVAIMDLGYQGIDTTAQAEVGFYSHRNGQANFDTDATPHGTACAEIIRDVAPNCVLRIYRLDAYLDITTAVYDAVSWGADVISASLAWFDTPGNGAACTAANTAINAGVTWVNAAGNFGDRQYWETASPQLTGYNGGNYVDFNYPYGDPYEYVDAYTGTTCELEFAFEAPSAAYARYQLEVWSWDGANLALIASGTAGTTAQWVNFTPVSGYTYYALLKQTQSGTAPKMRLFSAYNTLNYNTASGSVANPGSLADVLTIGAVHHNNYYSGGYAESYSSHGGGIWNLPLDWCAPTGVSCISYGTGGFTGTSAACPHMAGLMALQLSDPGLSAAPVTYLYVTDLGATGWDESTGLGIIWAFIDNFELDNSSTYATSLAVPGSSSSNHSISPGVDEDWYQFTTGSTQAVTLETSGSAGGDTLITLYDSSLTQYASADNGGVGSYSLLYLPALSAGTWYVKVEEDGNDAVISDYTLSLTAANTGPPGDVTLSAPGDGATGVATGTSLDWLAAQGMGTISYQCQVATDSAFNNLAYDQSGLTALSATPGTLNYSTQYWWRVRAVNQYGNGVWSAARTFTTQDGPPGAPTLLAPGDGSTGVVTTPGLYWVAPTTGNGPFTYQLDVCTDQAFPAGITITNTTAQDNLQLSALGADTTYYWRVRASNAAGPGPWSTVWSFHTQGASGGGSGGGGGGGGGGCSSGDVPQNWQLWLASLLLIALAWRLARRARDRHA